MINDLKDYYKKSMDNFTKLNLPELEKKLNIYVIYVIKMNMNHSNLEIWK